MKKVTNPHFDDGILVWSDEYSGKYEPPAEGYQTQFELQWKLALERFGSFHKGPGVSLEDSYIQDRIQEWTKNQGENYLFHDPDSGTRVLDRPIGVDLIKNKNCIDIGCGIGRWSKVMLALGANSVLSVDMSESALKSVSNFNSNVRQVNLLKLAGEHPDLVGKYDFACLWGVAMCTHDPLTAFLNASATLKSGGHLYLMVYCPEGLHGQFHTNELRRRFHAFKSIDEKLAFVEHIYRREFDASFPIIENLRNFTLNLLGYSKHSIIGVLDMLSPFYNWVIPWNVIQGWSEKGGFKNFEFLNEFEPKKAAYHVLFRKA